jgi:hypothetical protein
MFLYCVLERLCACADGYFCLKVESILRADRQYVRWSVYVARMGVSFLLYLNPYHFHFPSTQQIYLYINFVLHLQSQQI